MHPCIRSSDIKIFSSVAAIPDSWDGLLPNAHPLRKETLMQYESISLPDIVSYYAIATWHGNIKALACFQLLGVKPKHVNETLLSGWQAYLTNTLLRIFSPTLLVAGHLFRHDIPNFYAAPDTGNIEAFRCYEEMIGAVSRKSCAVATLVKDVPEHLIPYFQNFAPHYAPLRNDISMRMPLPAAWVSIDDYEAALKHKYAQRFRKVRSSLSSLAVRELTMEEVQEQSARLFELYEQVSRNQAFSMGLLNEAFLPSLKKYYGDRLKIWAFYEGDVMVAFASAWAHEEAFDMFYIGFDYARNSALNLYFNILYFSIEQAIRLRKPMLILGRTALEAKARLGCTPHYLSTFLLVRQPLLRRFVHARINTQHQQEGSWEERHPLKAAKRLVTAR